MRRLLITTAVGFMGILAAAAWAVSPEEKSAGGKSPCAGHKDAAASESGAPCEKPCAKKVMTVAETSAGAEKANAVIEKLPKLTYKIGEEKTCCAKMAAGVAEKSGKPVQYVVGEEVFSTEADARVKLTTLLEQEAEAMQAMQYAVGNDCMRCPMTAKKAAQEKQGKVAYRVGGVDFDSEPKAQKAVELVAEAAGNAKLSYKVDGQSFCCDKMAGVKVKETGKPMTYVVAEQEVQSEGEAKLLLTQTKIRLIVETAAALLAS